MQKVESSFIISSDTTTGATNKSSNGDYFEINLKDPLKIPTKAQNVKISANTASIWWTVFNIQENVNDTLYIDDGAPFTVEFPSGLYGLADLNSRLSLELVNQGKAADLVVFTSDSATQKVVMTFNAVGVSVDFTQADTPRLILGFNSAVIGPNVTSPFSYTAPNTANFNNIDYFLIHTDMCDLGMRVGDSYSQTLARVLITASPGSQIIYTPQNPPKVSANKLKGASITTLTFWLTDQNNVGVNTAGDNWSVELLLSYHLPA